MRTGGRIVNGRDRVRGPAAWWRLAAVLSLVLLAIGGCDRRAGLEPDVIAFNNEGVGLMGRFEYDKAREAFDEAVRRSPGWTDARVNLAIATLNRQQDGDERRALALLEEVLGEQPAHLRGLYVSGLLHLYLGETGPALERLRAVVEADPDDAYAAYFLAQALAQERRLDEALEWYRRALDLDPYLRSAYYGAALALRQSGDAEAARAMLEDYQRYADNPRARLAEFKYTRMGAKAEALATGEVAASPEPLPPGPLFGETSLIPVDTGGAVSLTTADVDGDGAQDVYAAGPAGGRVLRGDGAGGFERLAGHPLERDHPVTVAAWGDWDNDGLLDAWLCGPGWGRLYRQPAAGQWQDVTDAAGMDPAGTACADAAFLDADHDGDLDLFVVDGGGPDELYNNDGDGGFRRLAGSQGIAGDAAGRQLLTLDLDGDRDTDLLVINEAPPHYAWINDRLWNYRPAQGLDGLLGRPVAAATTADRDADGRGELYVVTGTGALERWSRDHGGRWSGEPLGQVDGRDPFLAPADFDGDARPEILAGSDAGTVIFRDGEALPLVAEGPTGPPLPLMTDPGTGPALVAPAEGGLAYWPPGPGRHRFVALRVSGREDRAESMRSNASGIGTGITLRVLDRWALATSFDPHSGAGQSLQPVMLGLAGRDTADYVALHWSDGVFQTELGLGPGLQVITETQRQLSSCPVLFAWDGERWRFVSDILGVGGIGFMIEPGVYGEPRPWEYFLLPEGALAPQAGQLELRIGEPMEENAYLDQVRLQVFDLPPGWDLLVDERFGIAGPAPTGRPMFYRDELLPVSAVNDRGSDVTATVVAVDRMAAPVGRIDRRYIGLLEHSHVLTIEFGEDLDAAGGEPVLVVDGWVEYPYSQTVFAAWQSGASYDPPDLEARDGQGRWHMVQADFGYPAGMPRRMALPLPALPPGTRALRLTTNQEVYWDRIAVVGALPAPGVATHLLEPATARLTKSGFPLRTTGEQRLPHYDYELRQAFWDTRYLEGYYTALGPVEPLLAGLDDAVVVMGSGEEVRLSFPAPAAAPAGWRRRYVLEARGWAKDMDLFTRDGGTVGPLPLRGPLDPEAAARRERLHDRTLTRFQAGH